MKTRSEFVVKKLKKIESKKILDIGFVGEYEVPFIHHLMIDVFKNKKIDGLDFRKDFKSKVSITKSLNSTGNYFNEDLYKFKKYNEYDTICLFEVIEHLENPYDALKIISSELNSNSYILLTYPNPLGLRKFKNYILEKDILRNSFLKKYKGADDHLIFPMPMSIINFCKNNKMEVVDVEYIKGVTSKIPYLRKLSSYIGMVIKITK